MKLDTDTMNATERFRATIHHQEPDRVPCYVMGIPPYSKCYKEFVEREEMGKLDDFFDNDENIMITPMGDYTLKYFFGAEVEMAGIGVHHHGGNNLLFNDDGSLDLDPSAFNKIPAGKEYKYLSPSGTISGIKILPSGEKYNWYIDGYLQKKEQARHCQLKAFAPSRIDQNQIFGACLQRSSNCRMPCSSSRETRRTRTFCRIWRAVHSKWDRRSRNCLKC